MTQHSLNRKRILARAIALAFFLSLIIGTGPGTLLANRPESIWGWPQLYMWGLFWCIILILLVVAASRFVWNVTSDDEESPLE